MLKPSEVLMRAHNEGRVCGRSYVYEKETLFPVENIPSRVFGQLCALGFLIEPFKAEFDAERDDASSFVAEKYNIPVHIVSDVERRYEGWFQYDNPQPLNVVAEWLEGIGY